MKGITKSVRVTRWSKVYLQPLDNQLYLEVELSTKNLPVREGSWVDIRLFDVDPRKETAAETNEAGSHQTMPRPVDAGFVEDLESGDRKALGVVTAAIIAGEYVRFAPENIPLNQLSALDDFVQRLLGT